MRVDWAAIPILALTIGGVPLAPTAITHASTQGHSIQALSTVTILSSSYPDPKARHVCLNMMSTPGELWTCAGQVRAPDPYRAATETVSCTSMAGKQTMSVVVSSDGNTIRNRSEFEPDISIQKANPPSAVDPEIRKLLAKAMQKTWAESTV